MKTPGEVIRPYGEVIWPYVVEAAPFEAFKAIPFDFTLLANQTLSAIYTLSTGWDFITSVINSFSTGAFSLNIKDIYTGEDLFINFVRGTLITGNGQESFVMPRSHRFLGGRTIEVTVRDLSAAPNTVQVVLIGYKKSLIGEVIETPSPTSMTTKYGKPAGEMQKFLIDRLSVIPFNFTVNGGTYSDKYPISKGFDFFWEVLNARPFPTYVGNDRDYTIQIKDEYVTEDFFISPIRNSIISGSGQRPFILPRPYIFQGGTHITVTVTDTNPAPPAPMDVQLAFVGYKVRRI